MPSLPYRNYLTKNFMKSDTSQHKQLTFNGLITAPGIAIGRVFVFKPYAIDLAEISQKAQASLMEVELFNDARLQVLEQLEFAYKLSTTSFSEEQQAIFESQSAFLNDQILIDEITELIELEALSAVQAVSQILSNKSDHFLNLDNAFFRDRAFDIIDLKQKLILALLGVGIDYQLNAPAIIVAENLSPADTVNFNRNLILGILADQGGYSSHAAILARGLSIPSMVNNNNLSHLLHNNETVILDGFKGEIIVNPHEDVLEKYRGLQAQLKNSLARHESDVVLNARTTDGVDIGVWANIEFAHEALDAQQKGADGIGLFRTEVFFFERANLPSEECQFDFYKKTLEHLDGKPCVVRTIDLGGDKLLKGVTELQEPNPFLGWRAIRFCLDKPKIFKTQLRAMLRASAFGDLKILLPMVNTVDEVLQVKEILREVRTDLKNKGIATAGKTDLGIMIETPAAAIMAPILATYVDFFSIGSNDLTQYVLAVDRTNKKVSDRYNPFEPAVLKMLHCTIEAAVSNKIPVSICGELGAKPLAVPLLIGMGLHSFSVAPSNITMVRRIINSVGYKECRSLFEAVQTLHRAEEIEEKCTMFLQEHKIELPNFTKEIHNVFNGQNGL